MNGIENEMKNHQSISSSKIYNLTIDLKCLVEILSQLFDGMKNPEELKDNCSFLYHNYEADLLNSLALIKHITKTTKRIKKMTRENLYFIKN